MTVTEGSGTPFGPFMLHGAIGRGATATVYLASVVATGEQVAVKVLDQGFAALPGLAERLEGESAVLAALSGPHVVGGRGTGVVDGYRYLAMEYVDGASLRAVERAAGRLDVLQALAVTEGALAGLAMAHAYGLVHGDVKPENILVDRSGASRLVDFGEVVTVGGATEGGTPAYMSPEAAYGQLLDERSDLYSMGVVLYEALAGRRPFEAATELAVLRMHVEEAPAPVIDLGPATQALLARTLAKDPADRPQSAAALHAELGEVVDAEYGSDWRRRAAVAGLVALGATAITELAAPTSAGAAAGTGGGAASGGGGGMAPSGGVPAVTAKASAGGLISSHPLMVGIVAVVAAAGLAVGGFAAARAGSSSSASAPTTVPSTTATTGAAPLLGSAPSSQALNFGISGFGQVTPAYIGVSGVAGGGLQVSTITWSKWGAPEAMGRGQTIDGTGQSGPVSSWPLVPATVVAFDLGNCGGGPPAYEKVEWYIPQDGQTFDPNTAMNACNGGIPANSGNTG